MMLSPVEFSTFLWVSSKRAVCLEIFFKKYGLAQFYELFQVLQEFSTKNKIFLRVIYWKFMLLCTIRISTIRAVRYFKKLAVFTKLHWKHRYASNFSRLQKMPASQQTATNALHMIKNFHTGLFKFQEGFGFSRSIIWICTFSCTIKICY